MLPATSIFRRMPFALPLAARRHFGALAYAHDSAELSFHRLKDAARSYQFPAEGLNHEAAGWIPASRLSIIADAWACIDHLSRVKELVQRFEVADPPPAEIVLFVNAVNPAAEIRDKLRRLDEEIFEGGNSVEGHPVLGTVSWSDTRSPKGLIRFSISSGPTIDGSLMAAVPVSGALQTGDIVDVQLTVADRTVNLDEMMEALADFMAKFETRVSRATLTGLLTAAQAQGVPLDEPQPHGVADMTLAVRTRGMTDAGWAPAPDDVKMLVEVPAGTFDMRAI